MRLIARRIEHQNGAPIDVHEDTDYTDWAAVDRFAEAFATALDRTEVAVMKAAVVHRFDQPLSIEDVPIPEPGAEQVLVRIETCGLCHTDIHAARGDWPVKPTPPFIPGHEGVGIIERARPGQHPRRRASAMRVAIPWLGYACGDCRYCNSGRETLCERPAQHRLLDQRRLRRVRRRLRAPRRARCPTASTRSTPLR